MANNTNSDLSTLLDPNVFGPTRTVNQVVAGSSPGGGSGATEQMSQLAEALQQLQTVSQAETESVGQNTQALSQNTVQHEQSGTSAASKAGSALQSTLGLGLGLSPLITGLLSLFGGGGGGQTTVPTAFALPPSVSASAGVSEAAPTQPFGADYTAGGQPRAASAASPQITVQVQAMDSQSFLDHSNDIALAVRQAMLESNVLSDVIREV